MSKQSTKKSTKINTALKIGLVIDDSLDPPDGVQQYVITLGRWLTAQGHEVHYITGQSTRNDLTNLHSLSRNMSVRFNQNRMSMPLPTSRRRIRAFLEAEQFDVLHVQMPYSPWLAGVVIAEAPSTTAVVGTFHIAPYAAHVTLANTLLRLWVGSTIKRFDAIMSVSSTAQAFAQKTFRIASVVVPNMVDIQHFRSQTQGARSSTARTFVFLGRLVERKGCTDLLQAVRQLVEVHHYTNFQVRIGGKGPLLSQLQGYVLTNNLQQYVDFVGFVPEEKKPTFLGSGGIAIFPSRGGESFGIVLLEAMASGALVLAAKNPGYASVLHNAHSLFRPGDANDLTKVLLSVLRNPSLASLLRDEQQQLVHMYDQEVVGTKILNIYKEALRKKRAQ